MLIICLIRHCADDMNSQLDAELCSVQVTSRYYGNPIIWRYSYMELCDGLQDCNIGILVLISNGHITNGELLNYRFLLLEKRVEPRYRLNHV